MTTLMSSACSSALVIGWRFSIYKISPVFSSINFGSSFGLTQLQSMQQLVKKISMWILLTKVFCGKIFCQKILVCYLVELDPENNQ